MTNRHDRECNWILEAGDETNDAVAANYFHSEQGNKPNHGQSTVDLFCVVSPACLCTLCYIHLGL